MLNGINILKDKYEKEKKVVGYYPLLEFRTYGQLRKLFLTKEDIKKKKEINKKIESYHFDDIVHLKSPERRNKQLFYKLSHNSKDILDRYSQEEVEAYLKRTKDNI